MGNEVDINFYIIYSSIKNLDFFRSTIPLLGTYSHPQNDLATIYISELLFRDASGENFFT